MVFSSVSEPSRSSFGVCPNFCPCSNVGFGACAAGVRHSQSGGVRTAARCRFGACPNFRAVQILGSAVRFRACPHPGLSRTGLARRSEQRELGLGGVGVELGTYPLGVAFPLLAADRGALRFCTAAAFREGTCRQVLGACRFKAHIPRVLPRLSRSPPDRGRSVSEICMGSGAKPRRLQHRW